ncbi:MAG: hypothetical protein AAF360_03730, partial [Pseudomonadota bacterium]
MKRLQIARKFAGVAFFAGLAAAIAALTPGSAWAIPVSVQLTGVFEDREVDDERLNGATLTLTY